MANAWSYPSREWCMSGGCGGSVAQLQISNTGRWSCVEHLESWLAVESSNLHVPQLHPAPTWCHPRDEWYWAFPVFRSSVYYFHVNQRTENGLACERGYIGAVVVISCHPDVAGLWTRLHRGCGGYQLSPRCGTLILSCSDRASGVHIRRDQASGVQIHRDQASGVHIRRDQASGVHSHTRLPTGGYWEHRQQLHWRYETTSSQCTGEPGSKQEEPGG